MNPDFDLELNRGPRWRRLLLPAVMVAILLIPLGGILYNLGTPRLVEVSPGVDAADVPAATELRLTFSRAMDPESVAEHLTIQPEVPGETSWQGSTLTFRPEEPWPNGATVRVRLEGGARAAGWPALPLRAESSWVFRIGQPRLVFLFPYDGPANLYQFNPTSGELFQLTDSAPGILEFDVAQDGSAIYYSQTSPDGASHIQRLTLNQAVTSTREEDAPADAEAPGEDGLTGAAERVVECVQASCRLPHLAPEGDYLAYERTGLVGGSGPTYPQVWLAPVSADGALGEAQLAGEADHQTIQPTWSPTGKLTYYDTTDATFVAFDPDTGERRLFLNSTGQTGDWDPTGRFYVAPEISFLTPTDPDILPDLEQLATSHLIRYHLQDNATENLSQDVALEDAAPAYAPDGARLAFARKFLDPERWTPGRQLWVMNADGSGARPLTDEPFYNHYDFIWSPDGERLAYVRFEETELTHPPEIWLIDPDGGNTQRVAQGGYAPHWLP